MRKKRVKQVLSVHANGLTNKPQAQQQISLTDIEHNQLTPLFQLAERLHQNMQPVQPSTAFVRTLGQELANNAKHQVTLTKRFRKSVLIGAAAVGSLVSIASLVGAIVYVIVRWREQAHTQTIQAPTV
ncbi:MAG: hypothetical protein GY832_10505 [Chloroflexi bacterium]|nr:hypothetical protein [Chloroflexota bacterium]